MRNLLLLALTGCSGLAAHGIDSDEPTGCASDDTACDALVPIGDDDDDDGTLLPADEVCDNGADDDGDGDADCADADCRSVCDADGDGALALSAGGDDCDDGDAAIHPGAPEACDGVDSDCDGEDCLDWIADFEGPPDPAWTQGGVAPWNLHLATPAAYEGGYAAQSGLPGNSQSSRVSLTVTFPQAGTISFRHRESSEANYDFLRFYANGVLLGEWSGENAWALATYPAPAGPHTLEWAYEKDVSLFAGSDAVWIDLVELSGGGP